MYLNCKKYLFLILSTCLGHLRRIMWGDSIFKINKKIKRLESKVYDVVDTMEKICNEQDRLRDIQSEESQFNIKAQEVNLKLNNLLGKLENT